MKRFWCMLLVVLLLLSCLAGCRTEDEPKQPSGTTESSEETQDPYEVSDDLGDLTFGTAKDPVDFTVLQWDSYDPDWCIDIETVDSPVSQELYDRQLYIEERFGIVFNFVEVGGKYNSIPEVNSKIEASIMGGLHEYDLAGHYSVGASLLITSGYAHNLLEVDYLDLSKSYWPQDLLAANVVNNQLYFLSGYLAPSYFGNIACTFYNQNMIDAMSYENPVDLVDDNQWTFAKLKEMAVNMYQDTNPNETVDRGDTFGLLFNQAAAPIDALSVACGVRLMEISEDGRLQLSSSCYNTKALGVMDYLTDLLTENDAVFVDTDTGTDFGAVFKSGRALFSIGQLNDMPQFKDAAEFGSIINVGVKPTDIANKV